MTPCATCDQSTPSLGKRTRCADCQREHRDIAHIRSKRRRLARLAARAARVAAGRKAA